MGRKFLNAIQPVLKSLVLLGLVFVLFFSQADGALAARSGGRIGGGSFRAPSRSYSAPSRTYSAPVRGGYGYGGGGFGFPFLIPFFGYGGGFGGLFSILIFFAIANFLVNSFRQIGDRADREEYTNPTVSVSRVQVGLLAEARDLKKELDKLATVADTGTAGGRAQVLQESTLALLRHPEYIAYGTAEVQQARLESAEAKFNQWSIAERSKFADETLSNYNAQLKGTSPAALPGETSGEIVPSADAPGEYIVVTIVAGVQGKVELRSVNDAEDLSNVLRLLGGVSSDRLLAVEVLWTPQAEGDTLTADDLVEAYPDLKLV
ncbi:DUF1517 domain-containing protein [Oscillatoriales cyanobacterium LEGE 11467]|uniref:DUF1517 domain-containing protein n=1 Tax=Zarconia navalis LEGE 11467 TaxID=1828826 RepID=A0A928VTL3_9CYAN|nr:DUF1517 domain-containing protein [Zarconia navalis]MBE9040032.1 DUF1517 domain-containing protein [Zarconia navalis LEGE 11467]